LWPPSAFSKLAEPLALRGLVAAAVRGPYCGVSVELPKEGGTTKCLYCGTTLKAIDLGGCDLSGYDRKFCGACGFRASAAAEIFLILFSHRC